MNGRNVQRDGVRTLIAAALIVAVFVLLLRAVSSPAMHQGPSVFAAVQALPAERVAPARLCLTRDCGNLHLHDFGLKPGYTRYLVSTYTIPSDGHALAFQWPNRFALRSDWPLETYDIMFFIWPDLSDAADPRNRQYGPSCVIWCGGRMLVRAFYSPPRPATADLSLRMFFWPYLQQGETLQPAAPPAGYDFAVSVVKPLYPMEDKTLYYRLAKPGLPSLLAVCSDKTRGLLCKGSAQSSRYPGLELDVSFYRASLKDWPKLASSILTMLDDAVVGHIP